MRATATLITALYASVASGQTSSEQNLDRVFRFNHTETEQALQEAAMVIRGMADIREASTDIGQRAMKVRGTPVQIALADWLYDQLDQPANRQPHAPQGQNANPHEYRMPGGGDDLVRIFYLTHAATLQDLQEIATTTRGLTYIRRLFTYNAPRAIVVRGTAGQISMAEWLVSELDRPASQRVAAAYEYRAPGSVDDVTRVFYLTPSATVLALQEIATAIRGTADIRQLFTYNAPRAVLLRGTTVQLAMAQWLVDELDKPANQPGQALAHNDYRLPGASDDVMRVYYLTDPATPRTLQEIGTEIRTATAIGRIFLYYDRRALTLRGTAHQLALADRLIKDRIRSH